MKLEHNEEYEVSFLLTQALAMRTAISALSGLEQMDFFAKGPLLKWCISLGFTLCGMKFAECLMLLTVDQAALGSVFIWMCHAQH